MSVDVMHTVLLWAGLILIVLFIFFFVIIRIVRRFVHIPIPALVARVIDNPVRRRIQPPSKVLDWIDIQDGMDVLEVGPGPGTFTTEAAARVGKGKILAADIQPAVISALRRRIKKENITNVVPLVASAYELPFPNSALDRVFMIAVLAEIPDREKALREVNRILKDDGLLAIGEFLPDPDYPRRSTVICWCHDSGLELVRTHGGMLHYVLTFEKSQCQ